MKTILSSKDTMRRMLLVIKSLKSSRLATVSMRDGTMLISKKGNIQISDTTDLED